MKFSIGLTGGIGSGKSTVARCFVDAGIEVIDTDAIAHALTRPGGAAIGAIRDEFGPAMITADGAMDRAKMRELVFTQANAKSRLQHILHPMIRAQAEQAAGLATSAYLVFDVPLLVESGQWRERVDRILVIDCSEETQIARAMARSHLDRATVQAIMASQATRAQRKSVADDIIDNDGSLADLRAQFMQLHLRYLELAA